MLLELPNDCVCVSPKQKSFLLPMPISLDISSKMATLRLFLIL